MLTSVSRSVRTLFLLAVSALVFGLVVPIAPASAAAATVTVTTSGTAAVGSTLTANVTLNPNTGGVKIDSYKWQSVDSSNVITDIPGASGGPGVTTVAPYVPTSDMIGKKIQVVVTSTGSSNGTTTPGTGTSPQTAAVVAGTFTSAGTVTISDTTPQVDQTVNAVVTGTNPTGATYAYQWYTVTGAGPEVLISGATASTYTAVVGDLNKKLLVKVTASKAGYNNSNEVSSAQTTAVATATFTTPPSVAVSDTTPQVDQTLTANVTATNPSAGVTYTYQWYISPATIISGETGATYTVRAADLSKKLLVKVIASKSGYTDSTESSSTATTAVAAADFSTPPTATIDNTTPTVGQTLTASGADAVPSTGTTYSYQWFTVTGTNAPVAIGGATQSTYQVAAGDVGKKIVVKRTANKTGYNPSTGTSAETSPVVAADFTSGPTVTIDDTTPAVGELLTATASGESPASSSYTYQWYSVHGSDPAAAIAGATQSTYTVGAATVGDTIFVRVHAVKAGYNDVIGNSAETSAVVLGTFTTAGTVTISDTTPQVDQTVTANVTGTNPSAGVTYVYQWYTITGTDPEVLVVGATDSTFTAADTDLGKQLLVKVIASKTGYHDSNEVSSEATTAVANATFTTPPSVAVSDTTPKVGQTVTADVTGTNPSTGVTYGYQWFSVNGANPEVLLSGETGATYTVDGAELGNKLLVKVVASRAGYLNSAEVSSAETSPVAEGAFSTPPTVAIDNPNPTVGATLTATGDGAVPSTGTTYSYQWFTVSGSDEPVAIDGATNPTYQVAAADLDKKILVKKTANKTGYTSVTVTSDETSVVVMSYFTTDPTVTIDNTSPAVDDVLTATATGEDPASDSYSYQWYSVHGSDDPVAISGATLATYSVDAATLGDTIFVRVHAVKTGYADAIADSDETAAVVNADFSVDPEVSISDTTPTVNQEVSAVLDSGSTPIGAYTYQWYTVDGSNPAQAISGATEDKYTVAPGDAGLALKVRVTASKTGYNDAVDTSAATSAVAKADFSTGPQVSIDDTTPTVGEELTADVDTDSIPSGTYAYQWFTVDGGNPAVAISGATDDKYTVAAGDAGLALKVRVTASKTGYNDASDTSAATSAVAKADFSTGPQVSIDDTTPTVGQELTADVDTDSIPSGTYAYQWFTVDGANPAVAISGATDDKYTVAAGDVGLVLKVRLTASRAGYNDAVDTSAATSAVAKADFSTAPTVTITGTPKVGVQLTANASGESPAGSGYTYQWKADGSDINGATGSTFTPGAAEQGSSITVTVKATKAGYNPSGAGTSDPTAAVAKGDFGGNLVATISGTPKVGVQLTANASGETPARDAYTYQWKADDADISGATGSTFTPGVDEQGKTITVTVTANKAGYNDVSDDSPATAAVAKADFTTAPTVTITGTPKVGVQLTANASGESPAGSGYTYQWKAGGSDISGATGSTFTPAAAQDGAVITVTARATKTGYNPSAAGTSAPTSAVAKGDFSGDPTATITGTPKVGVQLTANASGESPAGSGYTYQWKAGGTDISGATGSTFTPGAAQQGSTITVTVRATKAGYNPSGADTSDPTAAVAKADFGGTLVATITGTPKVGVQLTASASGETPARDAYTYEWKAGVDVVGTNSSTFTPTAAEVGKTITVTVTATKAGYNDVSDESPATAAVAKNDFGGTLVATITGEPKVGVLLTANASGETPARDAYAYEWKAGTDVVGTNSSTFTPTSTELGKQITVTVTATKAGYNDATDTSLPTAAVASAAPIPFTGTQALALTTTTPKVGDVVTVLPTGLTPIPDYQFNWYRIDTLGVRRVIPGAIGPSYTVPYGDLTKKLQVEVSAVKAGYVTQSTFSVQTARINYIALSTSSLVRGKTVGVNAKRLRAGQAYRVFIEGKSVYSGTATSDGSAIRTVTVPTSTPVGTGKRIWVSGYNKAGTRDFQVIRTVTVK